MRLQKRNLPSPAKKRGQIPCAFRLCIFRKMCTGQGQCGISPQGERRRYAVHGRCFRLLHARNCRFLKQVRKNFYPVEIDYIWQYAVHLKKHPEPVSGMREASPVDILHICFEFI